MENGLLKQFAEKKSKEKVQEFYETALSILTSVLDDLGVGNSTLDYDSTRIFPMGDYTNDTFIDQTGELEIVIASSSAQLIISNSTYIKNLREARSKKEKKLVSNKGTFDEFIHNFVNKIVEYFDETTIFLLTNQGLKIFCMQEYGFKILIRFATFNKDDKDAILSFWEPLVKSINKINLFLYNEKMEEKDKITNGNYKKLVRIFKNIRKNILLNKWATSSDLNKYFVELIIFNIPSEIMLDEDISLVFNKVMTYLDNCNILEFKSFDGEKIEDFDLAKVSYSKMKNFINYAIKVSY